MSPLSKSKAYRAIYGYDIFISYSRKDGLDYAYALAQFFMQKGYQCYIDQLSSISPGKELPNNIKNAVTMSSCFVLISSEAAQQSNPIKDEIILFLKNNKNKPLIPITINESLNEKAIWNEQILGLALINESKSNLISGIPSKSVTERIENALIFTKKSTKLKRIVAFIMIFSLCLFCLIFFQSKEVGVLNSNLNQSKDNLKEVSIKNKELQSNILRDKEELVKLDSSLINKEKELFAFRIKADKIILKANNKIVKINQSLSSKQNLALALDLEKESPTKALPLIKIGYKLATNNNFKKPFYEFFSRNIFFEENNFEFEIKKIEVSPIKNEALVITKDSTLIKINLINNSLNKISFESSFKFNLMKFDSEGRLVALAYKNQLVIKECNNNWKTLVTKKFNSNITSFKYSDDSNFIIVGENSGYISAININDLKTIYYGKSQEGPVRGIDISPYNSMILTYSGSYISKDKEESSVINVGEGKKITFPTTDNLVNIYKWPPILKGFPLTKIDSLEGSNDKYDDISSIAYFTDDNSLIHESNKLSIVKYHYNISYFPKLNVKKRVEQIYDGHIRNDYYPEYKSIIIDKTRKFLFTSVTSDPNIHVYDIETGNLIHVLKQSVFKTSVNKGSLLKIGTSNNILISKRNEGDNKFKIWNLDNILPYKTISKGKLFSLSYNKREDERGVSMSSRGQQTIFDVSNNEKTFLWASDRHFGEFDIETKKNIKNLLGHNYDIQRINYFSDSLYISSSYSKNYIWSQSSKFSAKGNLIVSNDKKNLLFYSKDSIKMFGELNALFTKQNKHKDAKILNFYKKKNSFCFIKVNKNKIFLTDKNQKLLKGLAFHYNNSSNILPKTYVNKENVLIDTKNDTIIVIDRKKLKKTIIKASNFWSEYSGEYNVLYKENKLVVTDRNFNPLQEILIPNIAKNNFEISILNKKKIILLDDGNHDYISFYKIRDYSELKE